MYKLFIFGTILSSGIHKARLGNFKERLSLKILWNPFNLSLLSLTIICLCFKESQKYVLGLRTLESFKHLKETFF